MFSVLDNFCFFFSALGTRDMFSRLWCGLQVFPPLAAVPCSLGTGYKHLGVSLFPSKFFHWIACLNCIKEIFTVLSFLIGTLRSEDGNGSEKVAEKVNSPSFNLHRDYSKSLTLSNEGEPSYNWIPKNHIQVQKERRNFVVACVLPL